MDLGFSITKHAKERIIERCLDKILNEHIRKVFKSGAKLSEKDVAKFFTEERIHRKGIFVCEYRKYDGMIYVFGMKTETKDGFFYRLITVKPTK